MNAKAYLAILTIASSVMWAGCGGRQDRPGQPGQPPSRLTPADFSGKLPASLSVRKIEYTPLASTRVERVAVYVTVPPDLDKSQLKEALIGAARVARDLSHAGAVMILGYRKGDDPAVVGAFSAGRVVYAPHGRWEEASTTAPPGDWSAVVDLADSYFARKTPTQVVSGTVRLHAGKFSHRIKISKVADAWDEAHIVATVPAGTLVQILGSKEFPLGKTRMVRYRVRVKSGPAAGKVGWVFESQVKSK